MNKMTREEAREFIRNTPQIFLDLANNKKSFICPKCSNGTGKNGTGLECKKEDKTHFTCFKCNQIINNDVIDIIAIVHGLQIGSKEAFEKAYEIYNIEIIDNKQTLGGQNLDKRATGYQQKTDTNTTKNTQESKQNEGLKMIQKYIKDSHDSLHSNQDEAFKYLIGRGLTEDIIYNFNIGYDSKKNYVVIPYSKDIEHCNYYILRNINDNEDNRYRKPPSEQAGKEPIFNVEDMHQNIDPVFVVESPFCALSIIQEGFKCVSIGGTGGRKLTDYIKDNKIKPSLILALDKEPSGQKAQEQLYKELLNLNIDVVNSDDFHSSQVKDPNEYIQENKENFKKWLDNEVLKIKDYKTYYKQNQSLMNYLNTFEKEFEKEGEKPISTGFKTLDNFLDGGLFAGLYCIGGISSLGKTTFTLQIADQIAESGQDVLIFSLEMSKREILAKSLSRLTANINQKSKKATGKTTREILKGGRDWTNKDKTTLKETLNQYRSIVKNIYIYEGVGDIGVKEIREKVLRHCEITGNTPVIIIDYLQILAPYDPKMTDKQNTDKNVIELKRLSRDLKTPVVVISSFNRENYNNTVSMASFKESGAIEYSSDVLIGLQFNFMRQAEKDENGKDRSDKDKKNFIDEEREKVFEKARNGNAQEINLKVLKNRNGNKGDLIFKYYPMFNKFIEEELQEIKDKEGNKIGEEVKEGVDVYF